MAAAKLSTTSLLKDIDDSDCDFDLGKSRATRAFTDEIRSNIGVDPRPRQSSTLTTDVSRFIDSISPRLSYPASHVAKSIPAKCEGLHYISSGAGNMREGQINKRWANPRDLRSMVRRSRFQGGPGSFC
jgi:hypothetical protein